MGAMADLKASLLLASSLVVFVVALGHAPAWPFMVLAASALAVSITSVLALTPRMLVMRETGDKAEINLLFCGHFTDLDEEQYVTRLRDLLVSEQSAQDALSRDLYQMGMILHQKKFRHLATAYTVALLGLGISAAAWIVALVSHG